MKDEGVDGSAEEKEGRSLVVFCLVRFEKEGKRMEATKISIDSISNSVCGFGMRERKREWGGKRTGIGSSTTRTIRSRLGFELGKKV